MHLEKETKSYSYSSGATIAQGLITVIVGFTYLTVGELVSINTIVVGNLLNKTQDIVSLTTEEASWFGSLPFLLQPAGALIGIVLQDYVGQRYGLMLSNAFGVTALILLYLGKTTAIILTSSFLIGLGLGFTEPSGMGYVSEYSEPRFRSFLCASLLTMASVGVFFQFFIASIVNWRTAALISSAIPILGIFLLFWIPDSPVWLLSKGKDKKALRALMWLRGWVPKERVQEEFDDMSVFVKQSLTHDQPHRIGELSEMQEKLVLENRNDIEDTAGRNRSTFFNLLSSILERRTMYPLFLISVYIVVHCCASAIGARMYILNVFDSLRSPIPRKWVTLTIGATTFGGHVFVTLVLKFTGKRALAMVSLFLAALTSVLIGIYIRYKDDLEMHWIFLVLMVVLKLTASLCGSIPWILMGEIFPVRTRHAGSGLAGAIFDVIQFIFLKTFFNVNELLGTDVFFMVTGVLGLFGCVYLYFYLPETEGKSLAEIEEIFSKKSKA